MTNHDSDRDEVEVFAREFIERHRRGERPTWQEYAERYPEHGGEIRNRFPGLLIMEGFRPGAEDRTAEAGPQIPTPVMFGEYRIIREVGRGGMGIVYEAEQASLGRHVALKVLPREMLSNANHRRRFTRETQAAARLHHTNIVPVFGVGDHNGQLYYVMQFIHGLTLSAVWEELARLEVRPELESVTSPAPEVRTVGHQVSAAAMAQSLVRGAFPPSAEPAPSEANRQGPFDETIAYEAGASPASATEAALPAITASGRQPDTDASSGSSAVLPVGDQRNWGQPKKLDYWQSVAHIGVQVAEALKYAHGQGVLHRDIKPANLLLDMQGTVWVTDFGLAKLVDGHKLTQTGEIVGTLRYMAPETLKGQPDARSELYSLGLTLYELLTLRLAFDQPGPESLFDRIMNARVEPLGKVNPRIPRDLQTIVQKALERDPAHRYQTAHELSDDLRRFIEDEPIRARRIALHERVRRWSRRNKGLAAALFTVAILLLVINIAGPLFTWRLAGVNSELRQSERKLSEAVDDLVEARDAAESQSAENLRLAQVAEAARRESFTLLADMHTDRGLLCAEQGDAATAALWFASAAEQTSHDPLRTAANRLRARNSMLHSVLPIASTTLREEARRLEFQPAGNRLLCTSRAGDFQVWDTLRGRKLAWAETVLGVADACWSPDGGTIALGLSGGQIQLRAVETGEITACLECDDSVTALAFSDDGGRLAAGGNAVRVWKLRPSAVLEQTWSHPHPVGSLAFDPSGSRLITVTQAGEARVYQAEGASDADALLFGPLPHRPRRPSAPAFVDGGKGLVTVTDSVSAELAWTDLATGKPTRLGQFRSAAKHIERVVASADGKWFAVGGYSEFELWDVSHPEAESQVVRQGNQVLDIAFRRDGSEIMTAGQDQTVRRWSLPGLARVAAPLPHMGSVTRCAFSSKGDLIVTVQTDGLLRVWKCPATDPSGSVRGTLISKGPLDGKGARLSLDGTFVTPGPWHEEPGGIPARSRAELTILETRTGRRAGAKISLPGVLIDSAVGTDGKTVAAVSRNSAGGWLTFHDVVTGEPHLEAQALPSPPLSIASRPGKPEVAALCAAGELLVHDVRDGKQRLRVDHRDDWAGESSWARVVYAPDGASLIVVTPGDATAVVVRDAETGEQRYAPIRPVLRGGPCRSIAISADSRRLATAVVGQNAVQVWDLASGKPLSAPLPHPGDRWGLYAVAFTPDGRFLVSACRDGQARVWDWQTGKLVCPPMQHSDDVFDLAVTEDGKHALTACRDGLLRVWELTTGKLIASPIRLAPGMGRGALSGVAVHGDRAVVSMAESGECAIINLRALLETPWLAIGEMRSLAQLASGQRIEAGDLNRLTGDDWRAEWNALSPRLELLDRRRETLLRELDAAARPSEREFILHVAEVSLELLGDLARLRPQCPELQTALARELKKAGHREAAAQHEAQAVALHKRRLAESPENADTAEQLARLLVEIDPPQWHPLRAIEKTSTAGATLTLLDDGSVFATGPDVAGEVYTIVALCEHDTVGAVRLEALADERLPNRGPGRHESGNFQLAKIELFQPHPDDHSLPRNVPFGDAWASFEYRATDADVAGTIDELDSKVWHIWGRTGTTQEAVFTVAEPVPLPPNSPLTIRLANTALNPINLGRFRVSTCSREDAARWRLQRKLSENAIRPFAALGLAHAASGEESDSATMLARALDQTFDLQGCEKVVKELAWYPALLERLAELRPSHAWLHLALARSYEEQGMREKADAFRARALAAYQLASESGDPRQAGMLSQLASELKWTWLHPSDAESAGGATMNALADQSILVTGANPQDDTYTVRIKGGLQEVTAIRLEVLPDRRLPGPGPGRTSHGNFTLTEVRVGVSAMDSVGSPMAVPLRGANATYIRPAHFGGSKQTAPATVLDGAHDTGWDVWPNVGLPQSLWMEFAEPLTIEADSLLVVEMDFHHPHWKYNGLGRFRLSVTDQKFPE